MNHVEPRWNLANAHAEVTRSIGVWTAASLLSGLLLVGGCSKPAESPGPLDTPDATTESIPPDAAPQPDPEIQPPSSQAADPATRSDEQGMELPEGVIPPVAGDDADEGEPSGGIEMPAGVPVDSQSSLEPSTPLLFASWEEIEQAATQTQRITVVDLWSLSCEPCLKEFPGLVQLHEQFGDSVTCIGVDVDFDGRKTRPPEYYRPRVEAFLASVDAKFTNYISSTPSDNVFEAVDIPSIPAVLIFDQSGKLVKTFADAGATAGFSYEKDVIPFIASLAS